MIDIAGQKVFIGGFHDHWARADKENSALLLAALSYFHYDFIFMMDGPKQAESIKKTAEAYSTGIKIYPGQEECYGWGHVVVLNPTKPLPSSDDKDIVRVFKKLKKACDLAILAHPAYPTSYEQIFKKKGFLDKLLDEKIIEGIQHFGGRKLDDDEISKWYLKRLESGKPTPNVGGWDIHLFMPGKEHPCIYFQGMEPKNVFDGAVNHRTLVFAKENSMKAIIKATRAGKTVMENIYTGELRGPSELVSFLEKNNYSGKIAELNDFRDKTRLSVKKKWTAGEQAVFKINAKGNVILPVKIAAASKSKCEKNKDIRLKKVPGLLNRNTNHLLVGFENDRGYKRFWAVETTNPVQLDVLAKNRDSITIVPKLPFKGKAEISVTGIMKKTPVEINGKKHVEISLPKQLGCETRNFSMNAVSDKGLKRNFKGFVNYAPVKTFDGEWDEISEIGIDKTRFAPELKSQYGANRPYPGPDVYSGHMKFAWTPKEFLFRIKVVDPIHCQPFSGHFTYNADCVQIAIDPLRKRDDGMGRFYAFNMALTKDGPELFRFIAPKDEDGVNSQNKKSNVSLGTKFLDVKEIPNGLEYTLKLPWNKIAPAKPAKGAKMGIYVIMFNNNGDGLIDTLHWPVPIWGMWMMPKKWGTLILQ